MRSRQEANSDHAETYKEWHHIIPKCLGGSNCKDNLVLLTLREHFLAHWLLCKIYPEEWKLYFALFQMCKVPHQTKRIISSRQFELARKILSDGARLRFAQGDHPRITSRGRKIIGEKMKGDNNPMRRFPELNRSTRPCTVYFMDGSTSQFNSGNHAMSVLKIPRSTWILARRKGLSINKYNVKLITDTK